MNPSEKVLFVAAGVAVMAGLGILARRYERLRGPLLMALVVMLFVSVGDVFIISVEEYRGTERGLGVTAVDLLAVAIAVAFPSPRRPVPFRLAMAIYFLPCALSVAVAVMPSYAGFGLFKLARGYFLYWAVVRACLDSKYPPYLLWGLSIALVFEGLLCVKLRYVDGMHQVVGAFPHQNSLGMAVNLVTPMMLALALRHKQWLAASAVLAGAVCIVLTLSRGALALFGLGVLLTFVGSVWLGGWTRRKKYVALAGMVGGLALLIKSGDQIVRRFITAPEASRLTRGRFNDAAWAMIEDHPLGIGLNNYSHVLEHAGYAERAGIEGYGVSGVVHHIYMLTLAEAGWLGLFAYLMVLVVPIRLAWRAIRVGVRDDVRRDVLLGAVVGLITMYLQGLLEWVARQPVQMYLFFVMLALVGGLSTQLIERRTRAVPAA